LPLGRPRARLHPFRAQPRRGRLAGRRPRGDESSRRRGARRTPARSGDRPSRRPHQAPGEGRAGSAARAPGEPAGAGAPRVPDPATLPQRLGMVLPAPAAHDAPDPGGRRPGPAGGWLDAIERELRLVDAGILILVDRARPERLGELVRALLPGSPDLEVHTDVRCAFTVPHGATLVLAPRPSDADWLNIQRPVFARRALRVILWCDADTTLALAHDAVDFFD